MLWFKLIHVGKRDPWCFSYVTDTMVIFHIPEHGYNIKWVITPEKQQRRQQRDNYYDIQSEMIILPGIQREISS